MTFLFLSGIIIVNYISVIRISHNLSYNVVRRCKKYNIETLKEISMYVIERLVVSGALKKPSELRAPGLCTIMFSDRLPE